MRAPSITKPKPLFLLKIAKIVQKLHIFNVVNGTEDGI